MVRQFAALVLSFILIGVGVLPIRASSEADAAIAVLDSRLF